MHWDWETWMTGLNTHSEVLFIPPVIFTSSQKVQNLASEALWYGRRRFPHRE